MRLVRIFYISIAFACCFVKAKGQYHFSQYFGSPLLLNPALTGYFDDNARFSSVYRSQWAQDGNPFVTIAGSAESRLFKNGVTGKLGVGLLFSSDKSNSDAFTVNTGGLSLAYNIPLDAEQNVELGLGFQATLTQQRINPYSLTFETQFSNGGFNSSISTPELTKASTNKYLSINSGILLNAKTSETDKVYVGVALYNANSPMVGLLDSSFKAPYRLNIIAGANFDATDYLHYKLSFLYSSQQQANETAIGGVGIYDLDEEKSISLGCWYRFQDAIIPYIGIGIKGFDVGLSKDVSINHNSSSSVLKNSIELSLRYTLPDLSDVKKKLPWY